MEQQRYEIYVNDFRTIRINSSKPSINLNQIFFDDLNFNFKSLSMARLPNGVIKVEIDA